MLSSKLTSSPVKPVRASFSPFLVNSASTPEAFKLGSISRTSAAPPATCGQAMLVPERVRLPVSDELDADFTLLPGAQMFVQEP